MAAFEITLGDRTELIDEVDGYALEGPLTTFFRSDRGRAHLDAWSIRVASFRSTDVCSVRRLDSAMANALPHLVLDAAG
jgi:hypothetical protein